jgi:radical SAM protein
MLSFTTTKELNMKKVIRTPSYDLNERPFMVIWEVTQACDLACKHCRAEADTTHHPEALSFEQGQKLLRDVKSFGKPRPLVIFTGGDPFKRPDFFELLSYGKQLGLAMAVSPSGTPLLSEENLSKVKQHGAKAISLSIDGPSEEVHDDFRGVPGSFQLTERGWKAANKLGLKVQINTTITKHNLHLLPELFALIARRKVMTWSVFFLISVGRGRLIQDITPEEYEAVMHFLYDCSKFVSVKTTEGHQFKRIVSERSIFDRYEDDSYLNGIPSPYQKFCRELGIIVEREGLVARSNIRRPPLNINAGKGFVFISHLGEVQPSGFLSMTAGNVKNASLKDLYQKSRLFCSLRDENLLKGACGCCEFNRVCGGSRSRAYAATGDALSADQSCVYQPGSFPYRDELTFG